MDLHCRHCLQFIDCALDLLVERLYGLLHDCIVVVVAAVVAFITLGAGHEDEGCTDCPFADYGECFFARLSRRICLAALRRVVWVGVDQQVLCPSRPVSRLSHHPMHGGNEEGGSVGSVCIEDDWVTALLRTALAPPEHPPLAAVVE